MKRNARFLSLFMSILMALSLVGCGEGNKTTDNVKTQDAPTFAPQDSSANSSEILAAKDSDETEETEMESAESNILVVYFSRTGEQYGVGVIDKGNTEIVAEIIAEETGADLFEVTPAEDYYPMTYSELTDVAKKELSDKARPEYAGEAPDFSKYSTIFIGAPVWWGDWPMIMYTFFEKNAEGLSDKALVPFSTHEGSGLSGFDKKLASACPNSTVLEGLAIRGGDCQNDKDGVKDKVDKWIEELGY